MPVDPDTMSDISCDNELCCCKPIARIWMDARTISTVAIENKISQQRVFKVRTEANASHLAPGAPDTSADGSGGSQLDEGVFKDQGKIYRTDSYTVHWKAEGQCRPLRVGIQLFGAVTYGADWLPEEGEVTISHNYLMEPPNYSLDGAAEVIATITVQDCANNLVRCQNRIGRP